MASMNKSLIIVSRIVIAYLTEHEFDSIHNDIW